MPRAAHPEEAFAERRAVLECLPSTLHALGLPIVMPKLRANPGKPQPPKYEALVSTARRADGSTKGDAVVARLLLAVNAARRKAAVRLKLVARPDLEAPAYYFIQNTILVLGGLVGLEDAAAFARLNNGRNAAAALDRLCRLESPWATDAPATPTIGRPSQVAVVGDDSPTTTTRRPTTVDDAFVSGCAIPSCPCPCPNTHALSNHRDTVTPRMYLVGHPSKVVVWLGLMHVYHLHSLATLPLAASCHPALC